MENTPVCAAYTSGPQLFFFASRTSGVKYMLFADRLPIFFLLLSLFKLQYNNDIYSKEVYEHRFFFLSFISNSLIFKYNKCDYK